MLNFASTETDPTTTQAPEWQVIQRGDKKKTGRDGNTEKSRKQNEVSGRTSCVPSLCDILDSPDPKGAAATAAAASGKEDLNGQVIIGRGSGASSSMHRASSMSMDMEESAKHKRKEDVIDGECLELKFRIEELESLIENGKKAGEEARKEAARLQEENDAINEDYERFKFVYFDSLCEAIKLDVSERGLSFKRRRTTKSQWVDLGAGVEQSSRDLFAEATAEGVEPSNYPGWISCRLSSRHTKKT